MIDYGWITKDLRPLDLESIYRDVDEKRGVTPI
jgi:hypothetical protein